MPIYEYACGSCEHRFETIQRASEEALVDCPSCGEGALKKLLSAPNFRLKGSGWYETDFKTGDKRNVAGDASAEGDGGKSDANGDGKADSGAKAKEDGKAKGGDASDGGGSAKDGKVDKAASGSKAGADSSTVKNKDSSSPKAKG